MKITKTTRIGVLMGGLSSEREVSLRSGTAIAKALKNRGYNATSIDVNQELPRQLRAKKIQIAFNALHGKWGEDGCVQGLLEVMGIPYTGSGVTASALCMDKSSSKKIFAAAGLATPAFVELILPEHGAAKVLERTRSPFGFPLVVKPSDEGSSVGISLVGKASELQKALRLATKYSRRILLERYVQGREIGVAIVNEKALGTVEIKTRRTFYDYKAKYTKGETQYLVPAPLDSIVQRRVMDEALRAHQVTGCRGCTRVDLILADGVEANILEVNTLPGMTELSLVPQIATEAGWSFERLCEEILKGAGLQHGAKKGKGRVHER